MKIYLHIERVMLEGIPISGPERPLFEAAMERELTGLLETGGASVEWTIGTSLPHVRAGAVQIGSENGPAKLGTDVARAVYQGLSYGGGRRSTSATRKFPQQNQPSSPGRNSR
jgi:hypothetical protein